MGQAKLKKLGPTKHESNKEFYSLYVDLKSRHDQALKEVDKTISQLYTKDSCSEKNIKEENLKLTNSLIKEVREQTIKIDQIILSTYSVDLLRK